MLRIVCFCMLLRQAICPQLAWVCEPRPSDHNAKILTSTTRSIVVPLIWTSGGLLYNRNFIFTLLLLNFEQMKNVPPGPVSSYKVQIVIFCGCLPVPYKYSNFSVDQHTRYLPKILNMEKASQQG